MSLSAIIIVPPVLRISNLTVYTKFLTLSAPVQLFLAWLYDSLCFGRRSLKVQLVMSIFIFAPVSFIAMGLARLLPRTPHTYLDNIILAKR